MKVRVFYSVNRITVETDVNAFLDTLRDPENQVKNILFSTDNDGFGVLIFYYL